MGFHSDIKSHIYWENPLKQLKVVSREILNKVLFQLHPDGSPVNSDICEEISKFCEGLTMVVYEKIFGSINK